AQMVDRVGYLGDAAPQIAGTRLISDDRERTTTILWSRSYADTWPSQTITGYMLWKGVKPERGSERIPLGSDWRLGTDRSGGRTAVYPGKSSKGLTWASLPVPGQKGDTLYWQYITTVRPHWLTGYSYTVTGPPDITGDAEEFFMVT